jgi:hypothetical protein
MTNWRQYAAWGSFFCGLSALLAGLVVGAHSDNVPNRLHDPWYFWYLASALPIVVLGSMFGVIGKDSPRTAGLILSGGVLLSLLGCLATG